MDHENPLSRFHPLIARWFAERVGPPTTVQAQAWHRIAAGEHVLVIAPTGSGKTLTAFLWALDRLIRGDLPLGRTGVLYVSPLKALNNDIRRNLLKPLAELRQRFREEEEPFPEIRVQTRSGDTPSSERRRMQRRPPEILITTPESLNLLLSSSGGRGVLRGIRTVILDEIHAVAGNKRGAHLMTAVERLVPINGEFQRLALSATVNPVETIAAFIGGYRIAGSLGDPLYEPRRVSTVRSPLSKAYEVRVGFAEEIDNLDLYGSIWEPLAAALKERIRRNRSTLIFVNSRRLCEKLTLQINEGEEKAIAYAHHGSLSREIREEVEKRLKAGELRAIVATNSLEMGIDIGTLDEVFLIQSPPSVSSAIQRVGRAGHQVGQASRGTLVPTHDQDILETAVISSAIREQDLETLRPLQGPLDLLAQVIVSMTAMEVWDIDALYVQLRAGYPYRHLAREHFELVLNMLAGRYAGTRIRELQPRLSIDRLDNTVAARKGAVLVLYASGGTIPDRGYFHLRHDQTNALIGELDEEFVWEAAVGQSLRLGTQNWRIERITHNEVFVSPIGAQTAPAPFWRGEDLSRNFHFSQRIARFLEWADDRLEDPGLSQDLQNAYGMEPHIAVRLVDYLRKQKKSTGCALPHRHHVLLEFVRAGPGDTPGNQLVWHTVWGGRVNRPLAMALDAAWQEKYDHRIEVYPDNDCVVLLLPHETDAEEILSLVTGSTVEGLLRQRLEVSGFFGARFRECAGRALLLPRRSMRQRMPLWMSRLRSQKLLDAVMGYEDFPVLLETWRTCLQDEFDMEGLRAMLTELESGAIEWSETATDLPSPMARNVTWRQINEYMYRDDTPAGGKRSRLRDDLLQDLLYDSGLRPAVSWEIVQKYEEKRHRLSRGYAPSTARELVDWVKERVVISMPEWQALLQAMVRDHGSDGSAAVSGAADKLVFLSPPAGESPLVVAKERGRQILHGLYRNDRRVQMHPLSEDGVERLRPLHMGGFEVRNEEAEEDLVTLLGEWLQFYGPRTAARIDHTLGIGKPRLRSALEDLLEAQQLIAGQLVIRGEEHAVCDAENFARLLRLSRSAAVPAFEALEIDSLPLFLAAYQGVAAPQSGVEVLDRRLAQLLCMDGSVEMWEQEILPARLVPYDPSWLDTLMQEGTIYWIGIDKGRIAFAYRNELDLLQPEDGEYGGYAEDEPGAADRPAVGPVGAAPLPVPGGRYDLFTLVEKTGMPTTRLVEALWSAVWRGEVANDTFIALRRGMASRFQAPSAVADHRRTPGHPRRSARSGRSAWNAAVPFAGTWFAVPWPQPSGELLEREERNKERVRILLDRYGVLFRELLGRELPGFRWADLFRTLRLMELSGEVLSGYFFKGVSGPQFSSHRAFRLLKRPLPKQAIFWLNAADPASLCGTPLEALRRKLPRRLESTHLVYKGEEPVLISQGRGKHLSFTIPASDPDLPRYLGPLHHLLHRSFQPLRRVTVETINDEAAAHSPYLDALHTGFDVIVDYKRVVLYRRT
jgi:ATP-dependent Lhr-like helicase